MAPKPKNSKTAVTKSRGSKTIKQTGDMNQREYYADKREKDVKGIVAKRKASMAEGAKKGYPLMGSANATGKYSKITQAETRGPKGSGADENARVRNVQRAGGIVGAKPRGSRTAKQVGNDNQREGYNAVRGKSSKSATTGKTVYTSKVGGAAAKKNKGAMAAYKAQRAGGKGR